MAYRSLLTQPWAAFSLTRAFSSKPITEKVVDAATSMAASAIKKKVVRSAKRLIRPVAFPKSAPSVYNLFVKEKFDEHKQLDPTAAAGAIMRKIAEEWKSGIPETHRQTLTQKAAEAKQLYDDQVKSYLTNRSDEDKAWEKARRAKALAEGKRAQRVLGGPDKTRKLTPYILFFRENYAQYAQGSAPETAKMIGQQWKALSSEERQKYIDMAAKN